MSGKIMARDQRLDALVTQVGELKDTEKNMPDWAVMLISYFSTFVGEIKVLHNAMDVEVTRTSIDVVEHNCGMMNDWEIAMK